MNRQSGRRRGRGGNNRPQNNGGGRGSDPQNRIDNRTRGNAAQLLEKYKGLARDAQMAGDRVNTEYYLQFADHYFRVLADTQARREEQQAQNGNGERQQRWREQSNGDDFIEGVEDMDFGVEVDVVDARRNQPRDEQSGDEDGADAGAETGNERPNRGNSNGGRQRGQQRNGGGNYRSYRENQERGGNAANDVADGNGGLDESVLPPAISVADEEKPRTKRAPRARKVADKGGEDIAAE